MLVDHLAAHGVSHHVSKEFGDRDRLQSSRAMGNGSMPTPAHHEALVAVAVQFAMMEATDRDRVFVADLAPDRARLGEANVMRLARRPAADNAGLSGYELAVLLVAQANGLRCDAPAPAPVPGADDRSRSRVLRRSNERLVVSERSALLRPAPTAGLPARGSCARSLRACRGKRFHPVRIGGDQRVLGRQVSVDPVRRLLRGLELGDIGEQLLAQRRRLICVQRSAGRT